MSKTTLDTTIQPTATLRVILHLDSNYLPTHATGILDLGDQCLLNPTASEPCSTAHCSRNETAAQAIGRLKTWAKSLSKMNSFAFLVVFVTTRGEAFGIEICD